jgi:hypothetical protein
MAKLHTNSTNCNMTPGNKRGSELSRLGLISEKPRKQVLGLQKKQLLQHMQKLCPRAPLTNMMAMKAVIGGIRRSGVQIDFSDVAITTPVTEARKNPTEASHLTASSTDFSRPMERGWKRSKGHCRLDRDFIMTRVTPARLPMAKATARRMMARATARRRPPGQPAGQTISPPFRRRRRRRRCRRKRSKGHCRRDFMTTARLPHRCHRRRRRPGRSRRHSRRCRYRRHRHRRRHSRRMATAMLMQSTLQHRCHLRPPPGPGQTISPPFRRRSRRRRRHWRCRHSRRMAAAMLMQSMLPHRCHRRCSNNRCMHRRMARATARHQASQAAQASLR